MSIKNTVISLSTSFIFTIVSFAGMAHADSTPPKQLSVHKDWGVYVYEENGHKVCFMASAPIKSEGKYTKRGDVFAFITNWTEDGNKDVFNVLTGYPYKTGSMVNVQIDSKKYILSTTKGEMAWADDQTIDEEITASIQKGSKLVIKGTSQRGTLTIDNYSLKGSGAAYKAMKDACR